MILPLRIVRNLGDVVMNEVMDEVEQEQSFPRLPLTLCAA
jgi:hypothetical protein